MSGGLEGVVGCVSVRRRSGALVAGIAAGEVSRQAERRDFLTAVYLDVPGLVCAFVCSPADAGDFSAVGSGESYCDAV